MVENSNIDNVREFGKPASELTNKFAYIENIPVAVAVCSIGDYSVVECNRMFLDLLSIKSVSDINLSTIADGSQDLSGVRKILKLDVNGIPSHFLINTKELSSDNVLMCTFEKLSDIFTHESENFDGIYNRNSGVKILSDFLSSKSNFTIVYFRLGSSRPEGLENCISIVKNGIRHTDLLIKMDEYDYMLIFSGCTINVAEIIMSTIENKFDVFNDTVGNGYKISIKYAIEENDQSESYSPEIFLNKLISKI